MFSLQIILILDLFEKSLISRLISSINCRFLLAPHARTAWSARAQLGVSKLNLGDTDTDWLVVDKIDLVQEAGQVVHVFIIHMAFDAMFFSIPQNLGGINPPKVDLNPSP